LSFPRRRESSGVEKLLNMGMKIDYTKCAVCGNCIPACPFGLIDLADGKIVIKEGCTSCGACKDACNYEAIIEEAPQSQAKADASAQGVWVFAEQRSGVLKNVGYELLSRGRELADTLKTELCAVCLGHNVADVDKLIAQGADKVYLVDSPDLADNPEDYLTKGLLDLIKQHKPEIVLAGATALGRSFFPRVAAILNTGLTADCTGLDIDTEKKLLRQTRPTFGGNIMATILCPNKRPQMSTVRPRVFKKNAPDTSRKGQIIRVDFKKESVTAKTKLLSFVEDLTEKIKLEDADVIVSGGRGLGKAENFKLLQELADCLGAALGSSRAAVDEGWIPYSHQVGQTGKTVCPKLYVACGISGAIQHLAGMQTSDCIVAINDSPDAPIFQVAHYGIVGDLFQVVPLMIKKIKG
jgi:electron transfer flavoprotein alpha subunit